MLFHEACTSEDARAYIVDDLGARVPSTDGKSTALWHASSGGSLLLDALQAKQKCAPAQFRPHLDRDVVTFAKPGPDGAFAQ